MNDDRTRAGGAMGKLRCKTFIDSIPLAKEKMIAA